MKVDTVPVTTYVSWSVVMTALVRFVDEFLEKRPGLFCQLDVTRLRYAADLIEQTINYDPDNHGPKTE